MFIFEEASNGNKGKLTSEDEASITDVEIEPNKEISINIFNPRNVN